MNHRYFLNFFVAAVVVVADFIFTLSVCFLGAYVQNNHSHWSYTFIFAKKSALFFVKLTDFFIPLQEEQPKDVFRLDQATVHREDTGVLQLKFTQKEVQGIIKWKVYGVFFQQTIKTADSTKTFLSGTVALHFLALRIRRKLVKEEMLSSELQR